jgi:hypothetical protein
MPDVARLAAYYQSWDFSITPRAFRRRMRKCRRQAAALAALLERGETGRDAPVLDVGAGIGGLVAELARLGYTNVRGLEPRDAARDYGASHLRVRLEAGSMFDAHTAAPGAEVLLLSHVLEHVPSPRQILDYFAENFGRHLLWIEVPDGAMESWSGNGVVATRLWLEQHLWAFTVEGLSALAKSAGYTVLDVGRSSNGRLLRANRERGMRLACRLAGARGRSLLDRIGVSIAGHTAAMGVQKALEAAGFYGLPDAHFNLTMLIRHDGD